MTFEAESTFSGTLRMLVLVCLRVPEAGDSEEKESPKITSALKELLLFTEAANSLEIIDRDIKR